MFPYIAPYSKPTGVFTHKTVTPIGDETTLTLPEFAFVNKRNLAFMNLTLSKMSFEGCFRHQWASWPEPRSTEWKAHPGKYDNALNEIGSVPALTPTSSGDSLDSYVTDYYREFTETFYDVADIDPVTGEIIDDITKVAQVQVPAEVETEVKVKETNDEIRRTTALAHREDTPAHVPYLRLGAKSLFASSFDNLNDKPTRTVYEGTPTLGDRGVWMTRLDTKTYHAKLAAKKKAIMVAEALANKGKQESV